MAADGNTSGPRAATGAQISDRTSVTVGLLVLMVGFAFWMGVQHSNLNELGVSVRDVLKDHEQRIRALEKGKTP